MNSKLSMRKIEKHEIRIFKLLRMYAYPVRRHSAATEMQRGDVAGGGSAAEDAGVHRCWHTPCSHHAGRTQNSSTNENYNQQTNKSWLQDMCTDRVARMYRFCLVCVCVSVRVPKTDNFHILHSPGGGLDPFRHVCPSVCPSGPGCLSGAFCPPSSLRLPIPPPSQISSAQQITDNSPHLF